MIPLAYVIHEHANPPCAAPPCANSQPHLEEHRSVKMDMIMCTSQDHALFHEDNAKVYFKLEEATRSTMYAASIKPYQQTKNGQGAWIALASQYARQDKFEAEIISAEDALHSRMWNSNGTFMLEHFIGLHCVAYVNLQAAAVKVTYQLPTEYTHVGYLLKPLEKTSDTGLQAAITVSRMTPKQRKESVTSSKLWQLSSCLAQLPGNMTQKGASLVRSARPVQRKCLKLR